jgi:hypothetical protein
MGNLKIALIAVALSACAAPIPRHLPAQEDSVAKDLIPPGYTQGGMPLRSPRCEPGEQQRRRSQRFERERDSPCRHRWRVA